MGFSSSGFPDLSHSASCDQRFMRGAHEARTAAWIPESILSCVVGYSPSKAPKISGGLFWGPLLLEVRVWDIPFPRPNVCVLG